MSPRWNLATYGKTQWAQGEESLQADSSVRECINEQTSTMSGEVEEKPFHQSSWEEVPQRDIQRLGFFLIFVFKNTLEIYT